MEDEAELVSMALDGQSPAYAAKALGRTKYAVLLRLEELTVMRARWDECVKVLKEKLSASTKQ